MNKCVERLYNGIIKENPTLVLTLGMCPTLAVTTSAINGIGMGLSTTAVLMLSNLFISLLRKIIPDSVRMPAYIVIVASFVTIIQFLLQGFVPSIYDALGIYIPLIVVNCIILGRAESYASKNPALPSMFDGIGMGLGFTCAITILGAIRELLGGGTILSTGSSALVDLSNFGYTPASIFILAPGAFFVLAMCVAVMNRVKRKHGMKPAEVPDYVSDEENLLVIAISTALVNNVVLSQFLGLCPFLGVSKKINTAAGMGGAVIGVISISSIICSLIYDFILTPLNLTYLNTVVFILVIATLVQFVEMVLKKCMPPLYEALGVYLPLITTNCAVLGIALTNVQNSYNLIESFVSGLGTAIGFTIAIVIMAGVRERTEDNDVPESFKGMPIVLLTAGLMSIAFFGFSGII